jgi:hypothetical protein
MLNVVDSGWVAGGGGRKGWRWQDGGMAEDVRGGAEPGGRGGQDSQPQKQRLTWWQWAFRSRQTGRLSVASWPNLPLWAWIATAVGRRLPFVDGPADTVLGYVGSAALLVWAVGELWSGVNPWRRLLGLGVLVGVATSLVRAALVR